ncbi:AAA family ATPase [Xylophilus ampelinus]|uniref:Nicotinamide riboside kinase n=1 Tax=Xylophilus ampelinus TaxID=54067 RepID=A0A318SR20_9BURK|nr:ATP-binding protein [Xylophilus ampelinus]MCS4508975.1 ATP-binding protein [Xylophilus ampelinus]PYE79540.1 nicotinamide riboside kinase [Xylophilus ampelinus]
MTAPSLAPAVAIVGAESTGKTDLAAALASHLRACGLRVTVVDEVLRGWCEREGRTPRPDEQMAIAAEQARRTDAARARPGTDLVVTDTTPLMTAVYSDLLFDDLSLYPFALEHQRGYAATLLTGLDLPWVADGLQRDGPQVREPVDARVRAALRRAALPCQVIYGQGDARLLHALDAINTIASGRLFITATGTFHSKKSPAPAWRCEGCGDPGCERRLFTALRDRGTAG